MRASAAERPLVETVEAADIAACRETLRGGSRSFFAASLLLPRRIATPASALYAFCRLADDLVDEGGGEADALAHLRARLDRVYAGDPLPHPVDRAFAEVVASHALPRALPEALLEGLEWDTQGRRYEDLSGVYDYAARVAGAVGAMMAMIMGARAPDAIARACDLGVAMQLTNICRDVGEDARNGRIYLPLAWMREAGHRPEDWLRAPVADAAIQGIVQRLLEHADMLYRRAVSGIAQLPAGCRIGVHAARLLYAEIGREVERSGLDSVSRRAVVPVRRKLRLVASAIAASVATRHDVELPPLAETRFLVEAVTPVARTPAPSFGEQIVWVIDLFARLEERDRVARTRT